MTDIVERVAKAIYEAQMADGAPSRPYDRPAYRRLAKAAIAAIYEEPPASPQQPIPPRAPLDRDSDIGHDTTINWNK